MGKLAKLLAGAACAAGAAWLLSACGQTQPAASVAAAPPVDRSAEAAKAKLAQTQASRAAAVEYSREFYPPTTTMDQRLDFLTPDYVEYGPLFVRFNALNHVQGRDGLKLILDTLSRLRGGGPPIGALLTAAKGPRPPPGNVLYQVVADGTQVMVVNQQWRPDPMHPGKFYQAFVFDLFTVRDGKMAAHWDDTTVPSKPPIYLREPVSQIRFPKAKRPIY